MTILLILILTFLPLFALVVYIYASKRGVEGVRSFISSMDEFIIETGIHSVLPWSLGREQRHKIRISGPKEKSLVCQICLGRIKPGLDYAICDCGKIFHPACLSRTGFCPYCSTVYNEDDLNLVHKEGNGGGGCPVCGVHLPIGATGCGCGAIFVSESGEFECPSCSTLMKEGEWTCPGCGEDYERCDICPLCGSVIPNEAAMCPCGLLKEDLCPECGTVLELEDSRCPGCGSEFEFVDCFPEMNK